MKKSFLMVLPVLALLIGSAHALDLESLPNLSQGDREWLAQAENGNENEKVENYTDYLERDDVNTDVIEMIINEIQDFQIKLKRNVYIACLQCQNTPHEIVENVITEAQLLPRSLSKVLIYEAYLSCANANTDTIEQIIAEAETFGREQDKATIFSAYLNRASANLDTVEKIVVEAKKCRQTNTILVYGAYLRNNCIHSAATVEMVKKTMNLFDIGRIELKRIEQERSFSSGRTIKKARHTK